MDKKKLKIELTELFMAKADWNRCFYGIIKRAMDVDGNQFVYSRIKVNQGFIYASATNQKDLGANLDEIVLMVLDKGLHDNNSITSVIANNVFFLN